MIMRYRHPAAMAILLASPAWDVPTGRMFIERFDAMAGSPLPGALSLPAFDGGSGKDRLSTLILRSRLRSSVTFPGEAPSILYDAVLDGFAAVVTRSSKGLDISVVMQDGIHVTTMTESDAAIEHTHVTETGLRTTSDEVSRRNRRSLIHDLEGDSEAVGLPMEPMPLADPFAPLDIRIFLHDEIRTSEARSIHASYVAWWLRDMEANILPSDLSIDVSYMQSISGISDQAYGMPSSLGTWLTAVDRYVAARGIRRTWKNKYVLITRRPPSEGKLGRAIPAYGVAMASLSAPYSVVAHELGHLFGAEHVDAEWRWDWWPCRTNMMSDDSVLFANCREYSAANIARIQQYVDLKGYLPD